MCRTLPILRLALAASFVLTLAAGAQAQAGDSPVPAYLLASAAVVERVDAADMAAMLLDSADQAAPAPSIVAQPQSPLAPLHRVDVGTGDRRPLALPVLYATLGALHGMDFYTTQKGLSLGAHETNPLVRNGNTTTFVALKAGSTAATILIAEKMWKSNKAGAIALMVATNVFYGAVVANNARVVGEMR